jgi:hypothetical protein
MGRRVIVSSAVTFEFEVNKSFSDSSHPITIPVDGHSEMRRLHLDKRDYRIIYPNGEVLVATMQHGRPGESGEFYQLTVPRRRQRRPAYLKEGDNLIVVLARPYGKNLAILEYAK